MLALVPSLWCVVNWKCQPIFLITSADQSPLQEVGPNTGWPKSNVPKVRAYCSASDHLIRKIFSGVCRESQWFEKYLKIIEIGDHFFGWTFIFRVFQDKSCSWRGILHTQASLRKHVISLDRVRHLISKVDRPVRPVCRPLLHAILSTDPITEPR